jgi:ribosomal protein S18 acetylase RimI-like enzyme
MSRTSLEFSRATAGDAEAIVALVESAYRGDASRAGWTTEADLLDGQRTDADGVRAAIASADGLVVLARREGRLVGCANLQREPGSAYFGMFAVVPGLQGGGIGDGLLRECERIAREEWKLPRLHMSVIWLRTELIDWYRRRGYRETGERRPFPYGDPRFGQPRRDDLWFTVLARELAPD